MSQGYLGESHGPGEPLDDNPFRKMVVRLKRLGRQRDEDSSNPTIRLHVPAIQGSRSNSSAGSSYNFVTAAKTVSISLASRSEEWHQRAPGPSHSRGTHSVQSVPKQQPSTHCSQPRKASDTPVDYEALMRSNRRRSVLLELLTTEDNYISDMRFLIHAWTTILVKDINTSKMLRLSSIRNLEEMAALHQEIVDEIRRIIPHGFFDSHDDNRPRLGGRAEDPGGGGGGSLWARRVTNMISDAQISAEVARVFAKRIHRLFIYQEYSAKYDLMVKDLGETVRTSSYYESAQRSLELMASSTKALMNREDSVGKKAMTIADLLVKPIQRMCRYPLLFQELLQALPVGDCPMSHMEVDNVLERLKDAAKEINRSANDDRIQGMLERTWILQDRLVFPRHIPEFGPEKRIRKFGNVQLCGVLHLCWQETETRIQGQHMILVLYHDVLCLAIPGQNDKTYIIQACINVEELKVVGTYEGLGLQCHSAPHSWTVIFEHGGQLYEFLMTACSYGEARAWITGLARLRKASATREGPRLCNFLALDMVSLGPAFGEPGTVARRLSLGRFVMAGAESPLYLAFCKKPKDEWIMPLVGSSPNIGRSRSLPSVPSPTPSLTPSRRQRARLEAMLSDVYSREALPFPGIATKSRSSDMIRRLSVVSIAGSFSRRSTTSTSSICQTVDESDALGTPATSQSSFEHQCRLETVRALGVPEDMGLALDLEQHQQQQQQPIKGDNARPQVRVRQKLKKPRPLMQSGDVAAVVDAENRQFSVGPMRGITSGPLVVGRPARGLVAGGLSGGPLGELAGGGLVAGGVLDEAPRCEGAPGEATAALQTPQEQQQPQQMQMQMAQGGLPGLENREMEPSGRRRRWANSMMEKFGRPG